MSLEDDKSKFDIAATNLIAKINALTKTKLLYQLAPEEIKLLQEFRTFKLSIEKSEIFTFSTNPYEEPYEGK